MIKTGLAILGSTGSIGRSTLSVVACNSDRFKVVVLTGNRNVALMIEQCKQFAPDFVLMVDKHCAQQLREALLQLKLSTEVVDGSSALTELVCLEAVDVVVTGIVGIAGLESTLAATDGGKKVLLANKESLVCAGDLLMQSVRQNHAQLLPIDSEHNAIFQCLSTQVQEKAVRGESIANDVRQLILTASGGPFLDFSEQQLAAVTPEAACKHPNWDMGRKISVDSATMMNKGLEYIEACWLFGVDHRQLDIIIHPQSVIHSLVEYCDGSVLAQLGSSDMQVPISYALGWPDKIESSAPRLDLTKQSQLNFQPPDFQRFPGLALAIECQKQGQAKCLIMNIANEIAVEAFLTEKIKFTSILSIVEKTLDSVVGIELKTLGSVIELICITRRHCNQIVKAFV